MVFFDRYICYFIIIVLRYVIEMSGDNSGNTLEMWESFVLGSLHVNIVLEYGEIKDFGYMLHLPIELRSSL